VANGAFGSVRLVETGAEKLAVKVLKKSRNEFDNPHLFEVFTEVSILSLCENDRRVTRLCDYGCTDDCYYIVMEYYPATLKSWRRNNPNTEIGVLLRVYKEFLNCACVLRDRKINHFDVKCDNVMLNAKGMPCLADFGESMLYTNDSDCMTLLNKGTEWIKSPEMLSIALNSTVTNPQFDRRRRIGAGPQSDIWSIGCLFYELMTGEFLFADRNWSRFYLRITEKTEVLIPDEYREKLPSDPRFLTFLEFVLQREVRSRPSLRQIIAKFDEMFPEASDFSLPVLGE
jgi:serine/threonine protein kinase